MLKALQFCALKSEEPFFKDVASRYPFTMDFVPSPLTPENLALTKGYDAVWVLTSCPIDAAMAKGLAENGVRFVVSRAAGTDHLDLKALAENGIRVANVPYYSPSAVAEFAIMTALCLLRRTKQSVHMVEQRDFRLAGLKGRELGALQVGVMGTGRIGATTIKLLQGFGCAVAASDPYPNPSLAGIIPYVQPKQLFAQSDLVFLHCPLTPENQGFVNTDTLATMPEGAYIINAARGGLVNHRDVLQALESGRLAGFGFDVYENEAGFVRRKLAPEETLDATLAALIAHPNALYSAHVAFFTDKAIESMIEVTLGNLAQYAQTGKCANEATGLA
ncbi:MAG: NAD(P)-dependent oxidoreductase [Oscillospiraceae bacterium]